jgi:hypothetical protein
MTFIFGFQGNFGRSGLIVEWLNYDKVVQITF